jgi:hypothetical protein
MISLSFLKKNSSRRIWTSWLFICLTVCSIHLVTLEINPLISQDEVQILDYGRVLLNQSSDWALTWYVQGDHPILPFNYPGAVMQEAAYLVTAPSVLGPRYFALIGAVLAATCALGWLMARNTPPIMSLVLAFVFLVDPIFSEIYRGGRIDGWAIAACLGACWLLRVSLIHAEVGRTIKVQVLAAGALLAIAFFLWPSAAVLAPLVILELFYLARVLNRLQLNTSKSSWIKSVFYFSSGGLIALMFMLLPIAWNMEVYLSSAIASFELQKFIAIIQHPIVDLFLVYDPFLFITVLVAFAIRREVGVLVAFIFALLLVYQTAIYLPRVLYLIPYFIVMIGYSWSKPLEGGYHRYSKIFLQVILVLLVSWNSAQVLVIRPKIAEAQRPANEPQQFMPALEEAIGYGAYRVLLKEWQAYYAGRALGWKMYLSSNPIADEEYIQFLSTMDYIILREKPKTRATSGKLDVAGFELQTTIRFESPVKSETGWWGMKLTVPQKVYPTIKVYQKKSQKLGK